MIRIGAIPYIELPNEDILAAKLGGQTANLPVESRRGRARTETLLGFYLLSRLLPNVPFSQLARTENGRPYLVGRPDVDFNFSHTDGVVVCAVEQTESGNALPRVGIDAERFCGRSREEMERIAKRWFTPAEQARWQSDPTEWTFLSVWTAKEAIAKHAGGGFRDLRRVETQCSDRVAVNFYRFRQAAVSLAHASERPTPREIELFGISD